jgi:O-acetyl-ADP-ribose deacetylase (regulator of RNase III)
MVEEIQTDIFVADADAIIHQANCFHTMGSGIARFIREHFPEAYEADCKTAKGDEAKLGTFSVAKVISKNPNPRLKYIINLYSQFDFGRDGRHTRYDAMYDGLAEINRRITTGVTPAAKLIKTLAIPYRIGSNLGGADWRVVRSIIYSVFEESPVLVKICENPAISNELLNKASK